MAVDLDILKAHGVSREAWRKIFEDRIQVGGTLVSRNDKVQAFLNRIKSRIQKGQEQNFKVAKYHYAIDQAWDTPLSQVSPTLLRSLSEPPGDDKNVLAILKSWGINADSVFVEEIDPKTKQNVRKLNIGEFFRVVVPLVKAYVTIRWAKLTNDRRRDPFLSYEPEIDDEENRTRAHVLTTRVNVMASQLNYFGALKQAVLRMLLYSICLEFPMEEWYREVQLIGKDSKIADKNRELSKPFKKKNNGGKDDEGDESEDPNYRTVVVKEGIRYAHPHPGRVYYDRSHPVSSFNTDSGCCYGGYWKVMRFGELKANKRFFNLDKLSVGNWSSWALTNSIFFNTVYPCVLRFPDVSSMSPNDREEKELRNFYSDVDEDKSVVVAEHFERFVPKDEGLGTYPYPIWGRFVMANLDTPLYAGPVGYSPINVYGYDLDESRDINASLALEIVPWQDQFSNILAQIFLSAKQNLVNATFIDTDQVEHSIIKDLQNWGERLFRGINWIPFSAKKAARGTQGIPDAFYSHRFPPVDTTAMVGALRIILDTLERVLVMSSQEVAQAASHEQTREEVRNIKENTSTRLQFTSYPIDDALQAKKIQLYEALMAHGEDEFYAHLPSDVSITKEKLEGWGFTVEDSDGDVVNGGKKSVVLKANKTAVAISSFITVRDDSARESNVDAARAMAEVLRDVMGNPLLAPKVGTDQALTLLNHISLLAGLPRDFKFKNIGGPDVPPEQQAEAVRNQLAQAANQIIAKVEGDVRKGLEPVLETVKEHSSELQQLKALLSQIAGVASNAPTINNAPNLQPPPSGGAEVPPGMAPGPGGQPFP